MDSLPSIETQDVDLGHSPDTTSSPAIELLKLLDRDGRHNLVAIHPVTGDVTGRTFPPRAWAEIEAWIRKRNGKENLYFSVNEPRPDAPNKKLIKDDIGAIRAVFADLDPEAGVPLEDARDAIKATAEEALRSCRPAVIVDSGGGFNFYWPLKEKLDAAEYRASVEAQGRGIAKLLGGDAVQNVDRILRLPGTVNIPDAKKRARGRTEAPALLVRSRPDSFTLEGLAQVYAPASEEEVEDRNAEIAGIQRELDMGFVSGFIRIDDLPDDLRHRFAKARRRNPALDALWRGEKPPKDTTGSGWRFALAGLLKYEGGFTPDEFGALCYVWEKVDPDKLTARMIARDWVNAPVEAPDPDAYLEDLPPDPEEEARKAEESARFAFLPFQEVAFAPILPTNEPLIKGLLDLGAMSVMYGDSNVGKTFVAMDLAFHVAAGLPYANMKTSRGLVVYVAAEGGNGAKKRIVALKEKFPEHAQQADFLLLPSSVNLRQADADLAPLAAAIRALGRPVHLLVLDTLSRVMAGGDENSSVDMGALVKNLDWLRSKCAPAHLMTVHHTGKDRAKGARGHSLLRAATDTEIEVSEGLVSVTKQRDLDKAWESAFRLRVHTLGLDADDDPITSCTVQLLSVAEGVGLTPEVSREVLEAMDAAWRAGEPWSLEPRAKDRFAVRFMCRDYGFKAGQAEEVLNTWRGLGLIRVDTYDGRSKKKGLRVVNLPGQSVPNLGVFE